ncbi:MAG: outer membrane beta-barrel protein, partial [Caulobacteraceae bacterium]|nr:outer membrane beta-barrel protein [Caulobacter sp.]
MPRSQEAFDLLAPDTMAAARPRWRAAAAQPGAAWGGFLIWPSLGAAAITDSNPLQAHGGGPAASGMRLTPRFAAERETGVRATVFYGAADARLYPARPDADQLDGRLGLLHDWAPRRDLIMRLQGELSQARDRLDSPAAITGTRARRPFTTRAAALAASVQKTVSAFFVTLGGGVSRTGFTDGGLRTAAGAPAVSDETRTDLR